MDDAKTIYREGESKAREVGRELDGHDIGDDVGNIGDYLRKNVGNAGDEMRRAAEHVKGDAQREVDRAANRPPLR